MVMEAPPAAAFIVCEAELLLEFLIVAPDTPAHLGDEDQLLQGGIGRTGREEGFHRLGSPFRYTGSTALARHPLDHHPPIKLFAAPGPQRRGPRRTTPGPRTRGLARAP